MKLPNYKRIRSEDFKQEEREVVEKIASTVNEAFDSTYDALNNKLNFRDNFSGIFKEFQAVVDENGVPKGNLEINLDNSGVILGIQVLYVWHATNSSIFPTSAVQVYGNQSRNIFKIGKITGLQANNTYNIRLQVFF